jgi:hypothetical protein
MRNGKLDGQSERSLVELAFCIDANVSQQEHIVQIRVIYKSFPDLQVLVVRIGWLVGRPSDMLSEADVPRSAEAAAKPFGTNTLYPTHRDFRSPRRVVVLCIRLTD